MAPGMRGWRHASLRQIAVAADEDRPSTGLRCAVVGRVQHFGIEVVIRKDPAALCSGAEVCELRRPKKCGDVLENKVPRLSVHYCQRILAPKLVASVFDVLPTECREALTGGASHHDVDVWDVVLGQPRPNRGYTRNALAEGRVEARSSYRIDVDGPDGAESAGLVERCRESTGAAK
jgi:hypothetical protein